MPARSWSKGTDHAAQYPRRKKSITFKFDANSTTEGEIEKVVSVGNEKVIVLPKLQEAGTDEACTDTAPRPLPVDEQEG